MIPISLPNVPHRDTSRFGMVLGLAASALALVSASSATATTLTRKSLSDLTKSSEMIFDGQALSSAVEPVPGGQGARTCVNFKILEVIAGTHPGDTIRLCFFGGQIKGQGFGVSGMRYPKVGERAIYLVESSRQAMLNPLIGWDQGRYLEEKDSATGAMKMTTADHRAITGLTPDAAKPTRDEVEIVSPEGATAAGVVSSDQKGLAGAVSRDEFVAKLRAYRGQ